MAAKTGLLGVAAAQTDKYKKRVGVMAGLGIGTSITDRNTTITIKSSPPKTARNCSLLGVRSGFVTKRNEQNSWQRRFCVMVPHTFLYYFEDEDSDTPRGIIDMEYYTQMTPLQGDGEHEHVLQIHSDDETDSMRVRCYHPPNPPTIDRRRNRRRDVSRDKAPRSLHLHLQRRVGRHRTSCTHGTASCVYPHVREHSDGHHHHHPFDDAGLRVQIRL